MISRVIIVFLDIWKNNILSRQKFISHFQKSKIIQSEFDLNLVAETFNLLITKEMNGEDFRDGAHFHR